MYNLSRLLILIIAFLVLFSGTILAENSDPISKTQTDDTPKHRIGIDLITILLNLSVTDSSGASLQYGYLLSKDYMLTISYQDLKFKVDDIDVSRRTALVGFKKYWEHDKYLGWYHYGGLGYTNMSVDVEHDNTKDKISSVNCALGMGYSWQDGWPDFAIGISSGTGKEKEWVSAKGNSAHFYPTMPTLTFFFNLAF